MQKIPSLDLWAIHLKCPTTALEHSPKRTEHKCGPAQSPSSIDVLRASANFSRTEAFGSADDEDDLSSSDEQSEHNVENMLLNIFASYWQSHPCKEACRKNRVKSGTDMSLRVGCYDNLM